MQMDGWMDRQTQTDMVKLPVTVHNSANVLEKGINEEQYSHKK